MSVKFEPLDISFCFETKPEPLDYILPGFVTGTVGCLAAPGATGKSIAGIEIAMGVCSPEADKSLLNIGIERKGKVVFFNLEDHQSVLHHRMHSISGHLHPDIRAEIIKNLTFYPLVGKGLNVMDKSWKDFMLKNADGKRLVAIDTFIRCHNLNENDNGQMSQVIGEMEMISNKTGAAILFFHHTSKGATLNGDQDKQQATRGASSIVDNCRWQAFMQGMSEDEAKKNNIKSENRKYYVQIGNNKENNSAPTNPKWLKRGDGGVLLPAIDIKLNVTPALAVVENKKSNNWVEQVKGKMGEKDV